MEYFDVYDPAGNLIGRAPRAVCHGNPNLIHRTAHVIVFNSPGDAVLLQKRSKAKDIQPGKWDTAVGGHLAPGEDYLTGACREMAEELGVNVRPAALEHLFDSQIRNEIESEDVRVFGIVYDGPFEIQAEEIDEVRFWTFEELADETARESFTPNLQCELKQLLAYLSAAE